MNKLKDNKEEDSICFNGKLINVNDTIHQSILIDLTEDNMNVVEIDCDSDDNESLADNEDTACTEETTTEEEEKTIDTDNNEGGANTNSDGNKDNHKTDHVSKLRNKNKAYNLNTNAAVDIFRAGKKSIIDQQIIEKWNQKEKLISQRSNLIDGAVSLYNITQQIQVERLKDLIKTRNNADALGNNTPLAKCRTLLQLQNQLKEMKN